jgi:hypothetical protein
MVFILVVPTAVQPSLTTQKYVAVAVDGKVKEYAR